MIDRPGTLPARRTGRRWALLALLGAGLLAGPAKAAPIGPYAIAAIPPLPGGSVSWGRAINAGGTVVGFADSAAGLQGFILPSGGAPQPLPAMPDGSRIGSAAGVNAAGDVVGTAHLATGSDRAVLLPAGGAPQDLGSFAGAGSNSYAAGINAAGTVVGTVIAADFARFGFAWTTAGGMQPLAAPDGRATTAQAINAGGSIAGSLVVDAIGTSHAAIWTPGGAVQDLGTLPGGQQSFGAAINDRGDVVGRAFTAGQQAIRAVLWTAAGLPQDLGSLGGNSEAHGINGLGLVVGDSALDPGGTETRAVLWAEGAILDLNALLPAGSGWVLEVAQGVNDAGQITGVGRYGGQSLGFVLTPVPAPAPGPLLGAGLAGLLLARRRRD